MTTTVFCKRQKQEAQALKEAPLSGPLGQFIYENVSQASWDEWIDLQIKIINEERLDLSDEVAQHRIFDQMMDFLGLSEHVA